MRLLTVPEGRAESQDNDAAGCSHCPAGRFSYHIVIKTCCIFLNLQPKLRLRADFSRDLMSSPVDRKREGGVKMTIQDIRFFGGRNRSGIPGDVRKLHVPGRLAVAAFAISCCLASAQALAQNAYITNSSDNTVSVINTATNTVTKTIPVGVGTQPFGVAVTSDGTTAYVTDGTSPFGVAVINTATNSVTATISVISLPPIGVAVTPDGSKAYVTYDVSNIVSVIDTATKSVIAMISVGNNPFGVAVTPDGGKVYVANYGSNAVSVINTATNTVLATIPVGALPLGVAVAPDGSKAYVTNADSDTVSVIDTTTNSMVTTIPVGTYPIGVAVAPNGKRIYVTNFFADTVSVIDTATASVIATIPVGIDPEGIAITKNGSEVYVANRNSNSVSVIETATNSVAATVSVGSNPVAFGVFIQPPKLAPKFAGIPENANCIGKSISALARQYGGLAHAAAELGYSSVSDLQNAVVGYCGG